MPAPRPSVAPDAAPPRAKSLGKSSGTFARKSAHARRDPLGLERERRMAAAFEFTIRLLGFSDGKVGELFGVCASVVRDMRTRNKPIQVEKLYRSSAPEAEVLRAALDAAFRAALLPSVAAND